MVDHGIAFGDHIKSEKIRRHKKEGNHSYQTRGMFLLLLLIVSCLFLLSKLFSIQLVHGAYYRNLANFNRLRTRIIPAPRGAIFDRNNTSLVLNSPGFREIVGDS